MDDSNPQENKDARLGGALCQFCEKPVTPDWSEKDQKHGYRFERGAKVYHCYERMVDD